MKRIKTIYWVTTVLFAVFMAFTSIPDVIMSEDAIKFITALGYPKYFIPFIGVAKLLGSAAILIPGFPRIKEWAYAGLFFDLFSATYSQIALYSFKPEMLFMVLPLTFCFLSYYYYQQYYKPFRETV